MHSVHDLRWLAGVAREIYSARTYRELHRGVVSRLHVKFRSIVSVCESASHDGSQFSSDGIEGQITVPADYALHLWDHPNVIRLLTGPRLPVLHLREAVSASCYENTDYFNALCRHNALHDQILTVVWHENRLTSFGINRDRLYSGSERELLALLHGHLLAGLRRVGAHDWGQIVPFGDPWLELKDCRLAHSPTLGQIGVLGSYFPNWRLNGGLRLPEEVTAWVRECTRRLNNFDAAVPLMALWVKSSRGRLGIRYFPADGHRSAALRLVETPAGLVPSCRLTSREREVLQWVALGKRDAEIAVVLDIAPATVSKHVEHVFAKLGVRSRTEAMRFALCRSGPTGSVREV